MNVSELLLLFDYPAITIQDSFVFSHNRLYEVRINAEDVLASQVVLGSGTISLEKLTKNAPGHFDHVLVGYGANASLKYLMDKFAGMDVVVPVIKTRLQQHDVVYASYFCDDGTLPATIVEKDGASVDVYYSLISEEAMTVLNETESLGEEYQLKVLDASLFSHGLEEFGQVVCYECLHGPLEIEGLHFSLDALEGQGRSSLPYSQYQIQRKVHQTYFPEEDFFRFCETNISEHVTRERRTHVLKGKRNGV